MAGCHVIETNGITHNMNVHETFATSLELAIAFVKEYRPGGCCRSFCAKHDKLFQMKEMGSL
uniref:Uncharacterized protein n=2 Tax=Meloidogyne incognita group TaxID=654580 RepID=A0A914MEM0_MELIC